MAIDFIQSTWQKCELSRILEIRKFFKKINRVNQVWAFAISFISKSSLLPYFSLCCKPPLSTIHLPCGHWIKVYTEGKSKSWRSKVLNWWKRIQKPGKKAVSGLCLVPEMNLPNIMDTECRRSVIRTPVTCWGCVCVCRGLGVGGHLFYLFIFNGLCNLIIYASCFPVLMLIWPSQGQGHVLFEYLTFHSNFHKFTLNSLVAGQ